MSDISERILAIRKSIHENEAKYNRPHASVQLMAASKTRSMMEILLAMESGITLFGENYLQEALPKIAMIEAVHPKKVEWHFIGPIQTNKTRKIAEHFDWVQSVDSEKIAKRLNDQRPDDLGPLNICIEVNINHESTKSGINSTDLLRMAEYCKGLKNLRLRGLMAIPKIHPDFHSQRAEFHKLADLWEKLNEKGFNLDTLSMGMTEDYPAAIAEGSTMVRIGTGIFGKRN